jgi:hypothetical protein
LKRQPVEAGPSTGCAHCPPARLPTLRPPACLQDAGGEDRPIANALLKLLDYICPNEFELARLTGGLPTGTEEEVLAAAASLTARGARNVLVTLGPRGALLLAADGSLLRQEALPLPGGGAVVDATAAGDAFRAAFAVALVEGRPLQACLQLASAAGAVAVSRMGAVPSLPTRTEAEAVAAGGAGRSAASGACSAAAPGETPLAAPAASSPSLPSPGCPYQFASRLNSMQARRDLAGRSEGSDNVLGWITRQSRIRGLSLVDLNHPQHTAKLKPRQLRSALAATGLAAGAIAMRFPPDFSLGAFSNPDAALRARAVALAAEGCRWAAELGARDLVVWPQYDGYDYNFQVRALCCLGFFVMLFAILGQAHWRCLLPAVSGACALDPFAAHHVSPKSPPVHLPAPSCPCPCPCLPHADGLRCCLAAHSGGLSAAG